MNCYCYFETPTYFYNNAEETYYDDREQVDPPLEWHEKIALYRNMIRGLRKWRKWADRGKTKQERCSRSCTYWNKYWSKVHQIGFDEDELDELDEAISEG